MVVTVVSVEVYPARYINPMDLLCVEMWNCYKIARFCHPTNCVQILNILSRLLESPANTVIYPNLASLRLYYQELCQGIALCYQTYGKVLKSFDAGKSKDSSIACGTI
jgi:hypothetical protein